MTRTVRLLAHVAAALTSVVAVPAAALAAVPPPPEVNDPWQPWKSLDAKVEVGECTPYTDDDRVQVSRDDEGIVAVEHCIIDGGQYVPATDVRVDVRGGVARITYLVRDLPRDPGEPVAGCSTTPKLVVWFDPGADAVESVEIRGFRLTPSGKTRSASL